MSCKPMTPEIRLILDKKFGHLFPNEEPKMKLGKTKSGQIEPIDNVDLFSHCSNGMTSCCESHYFDVVEPILTTHGISTFTYTWMDSDS